MAIYFWYSNHLVQQPPYTQFVMHTLCWHKPAVWSGWVRKKFSLRSSCWEAFSRRVASPVSLMNSRIRSEHNGQCIDILEASPQCYSLYFALSLSLSLSVTAVVRLCLPLSRCLKFIRSAGTLRDYTMYHMILGSPDFNWYDQFDDLIRAKLAQYQFSSKKIKQNRTACSRAFSANEPFEAVPYQMHQIWKNRNINNEVESFKLKISNLREGSESERFSIFEITRQSLLKTHGELG